MKLENSNVLVTGGTRGLGFAVAEKFVQSGAKVCIIGTRPESVAMALEKLGNPQAAEVFGEVMDVSQESSVSSVLSKVLKQMGSLDVLVNNAGITRDGLLMRMSENDFSQVMDVNLKSVFLCSKAVLRTMVKQRSGRIINMSSIIGLRGQAGQANYAASKAGMIGFTKSLAKEVASRGITVNAVAPGFIESDMTSQLDEKQQAGILSEIPLGRMGNAKEVADLVAFLASPEAAYITGQVVSIDGGLGI